MSRGPSSHAASPYVLRVVSDQDLARKRFPLGEGIHVIGASSDCDVQLKADGVSRHHARLEILADGGALVEDLGSRNGTRVGGRKIHRRVLNPGETMLLGAVAVVLDEARRQPLAFGPPPASSPPSQAARPAGPRSAAEPSRGASTLGLSIQEEVLRSLRPWARGEEDDAGALASRWLERLLLERVEILRRGALAAACGVEPEREPDLVVASEPSEEAGDAAPAVELRLWGTGTGRLAGQRTLLDLSLDLLSSSRRDRSGQDTRDDPNRRPAAGAPPMPEPGSVSREMRDLYRRGGKVAAGEVPILILGETGSGKEVLANWLHDASARRGAAFVALNCAALPAELLESELFGIEKGIATGVDARPGLFEQADGGTLFLDEIGDMALETQAKVLRALENRQIYRVGGRRAVEVDVRFLAATHRQLDRQMEDGGFRRDLYHRLAACVLDLPPLRERPEDVSVLAGYFFHRRLRQAKRDSPGMTRDALAALSAYAWPGNVRELSNEIARAVLLLEPGEPLGVEHLSERLRREVGELDETSLTLNAHLRRAERTAYATALAATGDDAAAAIEQLGVSRATFYRKLKELGLRDG